MKQTEDTKTVDMLGGIPKKRGRHRQYSSSAEKQAAYRSRHALIQMNVALPLDVSQALDAFMARQLADGAGLTQSEVIVKLLRSQLLRKR